MLMVSVIDVFMQDKIGIKFLGSVPFLFALFCTKYVSLFFFNSLV